MIPFKNKPFSHIFAYIYWKNCGLSYRYMHTYKIPHPLFSCQSVLFFSVKTD
ncbi:hypothetical protein BRYFOR_06243 [Marvinbryantia formatexigens DSM 14469]|uniref:Uncharacterized protein n=1 Tax=Marvinbryantia formatexigens DSM 14469 TaxID=478749 RepID=C6LC96_9FIRM|nr:hypothetical protein BRYFOR_06243 [Marvinbryantia formatexigens DSM 14469]